MSSINTPPPTQSEEGAPNERSDRASVDQPAAAEAATADEPAASAIAAAASSPAAVPTAAAAGAGAEATPPTAAASGGPSAAPAVTDEPQPAALSPPPLPAAVSATKSLLDAAKEGERDETVVVVARRAGGDGQAPTPQGVATGVSTSPESPERGREETDAGAAKSAALDRAKETPSTPAEEALAVADAAARPAVAADHGDAAHGKDKEPVVAHRPSPPNPQAKSGSTPVPEDAPSSPQSTDAASAPTAASDVKQETATAPKASAAASGVGNNDDGRLTGGGAAHLGVPSNPLLGVLSLASHDDHLARTWSETIFPMKLYDILCNPVSHHAISWMSHGRSWKVLNKDYFMEEICPQYFAQTRYESFIRQVNGWGFKRMRREGPDRGSYYHEHFLRGYPNMIDHMRRPAPGEKSRDLREEPDFYTVQAMPPLPPADPNRAPRNYPMRSKVGRPAGSTLARMGMAPAPGGGGRGALGAFDAAAHRAGAEGVSQQALAAAQGQPPPQPPPGGGFYMPYPAVPMSPYPGAPHPSSQPSPHPAQGGGGEGGGGGWPPQAAAYPGYPPHMAAYAGYPPHLMATQGAAGYYGQQQAGGPPQGDPHRQGLLQQPQGAPPGSPWGPEPPAGAGWMPAESDQGPPEPPGGGGGWPPGLGGPPGTPQRQGVAASGYPSYISMYANPADQYYAHQQQAAAMAVAGLTPLRAPPSPHGVGKRGRDDVDAMQQGPPGKRPAAHRGPPPGFYQYPGGLTSQADPNALPHHHPQHPGSHHQHQQAAPHHPGHHPLQQAGGRLPQMGEQPPGGQGGGLSPFPQGAVLQGQPPPGGPPPPSGGHPPPPQGGYQYM